MTTNPANYPEDWNLAVEKRKPIEAWVNVYEYGMAFHTSKENADFSHDFGRVRCVHLIEEPPPEKVIWEGWVQIFSDGAICCIVRRPKANECVRTYRAKLVEIPE